MLAQRHRRWANFKTTLGRCPLFADRPPCIPQHINLVLHNTSVNMGTSASAVLNPTLELAWYMKWNESGFRPPLCTYRLNWARSTSWGWWDKWDDTVLQTQDSKLEPWRSEAELATSRLRRLPTILSFTRKWGRNIFVSFKPPSPGTEPRTLAWKAAVLTTTLGPPPCLVVTSEKHDTLNQSCPKAWPVRYAMGQH